MKVKMESFYEKLLKSRLDSIIAKKGKGRGSLLESKSSYALDIISYTSTCLYKAGWNREEVNQYVRLATERKGELLKDVSSLVLQVKESIWTI